MPRRPLWTQPFRQYLLVQVPDIAMAGLVLAALHAWGGLPLRVAAGLFLLWIAKDLVPWIWMRPSYERPSVTGPEALVGSRGTAAGALEGTGYVRVNGELWRAELLDSGAAPPGAPVVVQEVRGLTLRVRLDSAGGRERPETR
jgi:membrane protein implicated in regulation of membrane protease activity